MSNRKPIVFTAQTCYNKGMTTIPHQPQKMAYRKDTAGHRMRTDVPTVGESQTLREVHDFLTKNNADFRSINYVYVLDEGKKLVGIISVRDLFSKHLDKPVGEVCKRTS